MRIPRRLPTEARRDPDVECTAVDIRFDLSILGAAPLDDVHVGHDLDPAHQRRSHVDREVEHVAERPSMRIRTRT